MKVAIIITPVKVISAGYQRYLEQILPRLANDKRISNLLVLISESIRGERYIKDLDSRDNVEVYFFKGVLPLYFGKSKILKKFKPNVIFVPVAKRFSFPGVPAVIMIQNMEPLVYAGVRSSKLDQISHWFRTLEVSRAVKNADRIIAISKYVQDFLIYKWQVSRERIGQVYFGADSFDSPDVLKPQPISEDLTGNFIFTAGSIRPARGLEDAILAMEQIFRKQGKKYFLVIAGSVGVYMKSYYQGLKTLIQRSGLQSNIIWTGTLNEREMRWCYQQCSMFLMTSRVEACPNIALEAMASGCLCVAADNHPLPEIFQDAAEFYISRDPSSLRDKIEEVLAWSPALKQAQKQRARQRAAYFNWNQCVEQTIGEFQIAIKNKR